MLYPVHIGVPFMGSFEKFVYEATKCLVKLVLRLNHETLLQKSKCCFDLQLEGVTWWTQLKESDDMKTASSDSEEIHLSSNETEMG